MLIPNLICMKHDCDEQHSKLGMCIWGGMFWYFVTAYCMLTKSCGSAFFAFFWSHSIFHSYFWKPQVFQSPFRCPVWNPNQSTCFIFVKRWMKILYAGLTNSDVKGWVVFIPIINLQISHHVENALQSGLELEPLVKWIVWGL